MPVTRPMLAAAAALARIAAAGVAAGASCVAAGSQSAAINTTVRVVHALPNAGVNRWYVGNRAPLLPSALVKLPPGSVRPQGWLRGQLARMADGFSGRLPEVSPWAQFAGSAWTSPSGAGKSGWEEAPYWLKGYTDLGYVLGDHRIMAEANRWLDAVLASQRPDGYFGPEANRRTPDVWPNMLVLYALRSRYEATHDPRILPFMTRYFRWIASLPRDKYLPGDWQKWRGGDNLDSIYWLYNRTGDRALLDVARSTHERTADWAHGMDAAGTWHGVNICQGFREPAEYYQQALDRSLLQDTVRDFRTVMDRYGQVPGGMFGADENARPGHSGPRQAAETCSMVEMMFSDEMLTGITGDPAWADRCEEVAFNSLPASMTPDLKGLHYLTAPNMVQLDRASKAPMLQNGGTMLAYDPHDYRCCQHNAAFGWPYFAEHLFMATPGDGLAAALYAPCEVTARVGRGATAHVVEQTDYPFGQTVNMRITMSAPARFPLVLRVPGWCREPALRVNGHGEKLHGASGAAGWIVLDRTWSTGDSVQLTVPMDIRVRTWHANRDAVSVSRGPLTYSLKIGERWQRYGTDPKWPAYEVFPTTPWNYGLVIGGTTAANFTVLKRAMPADGQPFTPDAAPVELTAKARRIPGWKLEADGLIGELPASPVIVPASEQVETVTLIPMGCARLRISAFRTVAAR